MHRLNVVHRRPTKQPRLAPTCDLSLSLWLFHRNFAANLSVQDLWYIGNTRWPQFTAHYAAFPTCFLSPREFPFFSFLDTLSNVLWIGFSPSAHSSRTLFVPRDRTRILRSILSQISNTEHCVSSSFQSLVIFDRSRATFLLILISVKKLSSFDRSSIFFFFLNPLKFKYAYVRFKIL